MFNRFRLGLRRNMSSSAPSGENNVSKIDKKVAQLESTLKVGQLEDHGKFPGMPKQSPKTLDKIFLVWGGHYRTLADVPKRVDSETMHKAKTWGMIRVNVGMVIVGVCISVAMVYLGKQAAKQGITVEGQNLEWHRKINEAHRESLKNSSSGDSK